MTLEEVITAIGERAWSLHSHPRGYPQGKFWAEVFAGNGGPVRDAWGETAAEALHKAAAQFTRRRTDAGL